MLSRIRAAISLLLALGAIIVSPADAAGLCSGSYRASSIRPLSPPAVIELDVTRQNPDNLRLASEFADGLRSAGVEVASSGNARLGLSFLIHNRSGSGGAQYVDFAWMDRLPTKPGSASIALTVMLVDPK